MAEGAYIPDNDEKEQVAAFTYCPNHTVFLEDKCIACGGAAHAIVSASDKMIQPQGDVGRNKED